MVIVMPTFAESDQCKNKMVSAVVSCLIASMADDMRQRSDSEGHVIQDHGGNHEPPDQHLPPIGAKSWSQVCQQLPE